MGRSLSFSSRSSIRRCSDLSFVVAVNSFLSCFSSASGPRSSSSSAGSWFSSKMSRRSPSPASTRAPISITKSSVTGERRTSSSTSFSPASMRLAISTSCSRERSWKLLISLRYRRTGSDDSLIESAAGAGSAVSSGPSLTSASSSPSVPSAGTSARTLMSMSWKLSSAERRSVGELTSWGRKSLTWSKVK